MRITIDIQNNQPLTGTASAEGQATVPFVGWLELLRVVAELAATPAERHPPADVPAPEPRTRRARTIA